MPEPLRYLFLVLATAVPVLAQTPIPTPESVLGARVGDDFFLASYDESIGYLEQLAAASERVELRRIGKTSFGLDWYVAVISSPRNLARLDEIRDSARRLAHPQGLAEEEARRLAREGRAIVHIDGGLHATEVAHAQRPALALDPARNNAYRAVNRAWAEGAGVSWANGRFVLTDLDDAQALARDLGLAAERAAASGTRLPRPRLGLYRPWAPSMDEGWTPAASDAGACAPSTPSCARAARW